MIQTELRLLAASFGFGFGIIISYGLVELLRQFLSFSKLTRVVSEVVYWSAASVLAFQMQFHLNDGILRMYSVIGATVGLLLSRALTATVFAYLTGKAKKIAGKRRICCRKRRIAFQNQLKRYWKRVRIKLNSFRIQPEEKES